MRGRSFILLLGLTALLAGAAIYCLSSAYKAPVLQADGQRLYPELAEALNDLAWMRIGRAGSKVDFAAINGNWVVVEKGNYPASPAKIRRLLLGLSELTLVEPKTQRPDLFARLDLDDPATGKGTLVQLQDRQGKPVVNLIVGKQRRDRLGGGRDGVYVRKPGENQTWLARGKIDVSGAAVHWLHRRIIDISQSRIASLSLKAPDESAVLLHRDSGTMPFALADPPADAQLKPASALAAPAAALAGLELEDVKPAPELTVPEEGVQTATFETFDGLKIEVRLFRHDNADWAAISVSGSDSALAEAKALGANLGHWVYALPAERAKLLRTRLADLLQPAKNS